jgi:hypothetical protein
VPSDWIARLENGISKIPSVGAAGGAGGHSQSLQLERLRGVFSRVPETFPGNGPPRRDENFLVGCNSAFSCGRSPESELSGPDTWRRRSPLARAAPPQVWRRVRPAERSAASQPRRLGEFFNTTARWALGGSYHHVLLRWWAAPFLRIPDVGVPGARGDPAVHRARSRPVSRWSYFFRFLLLSPMCLLGNLAWAGAFRRQVLEMRAERAHKSMTRQELIRAIRRVKVRLMAGGVPGECWCHLSKSPSSG